MYSLYGFQKYYGYTSNIMILAAAFCYILAAALLIGSVLSSRARARKLRNGAFLVADDLAYALVVFSTPNIVTAFCIEAKEGILFHETILWGKLILIGSILMLLIAHLLNLSDPERHSDVGIFISRQGKLSVYMPIIFNFKLITIASLLFVHHIVESDLPIFAVIIIQLSYLLFVLIGRPHKKDLDLFRSSCL